MSGKLDQSLDEIATTQRRSRRNPRRSAARAAPVPAAPAGGVKKNTKPARNAAGARAGPVKTGPVKGDSKIIVSNLPKDVVEAQIKDYFGKAVGPIKRVDVVYGPNSQSRGIANITFRDPAGASTAYQKLNGILIDDRPIKIEIVVAEGQVDKVIPPVKTLAERTTQPKAQPKSAAADKKKGAANKPGAAKPADKKARSRSARPAKKTSAELDVEMDDYFEATKKENATAGAPAGNGDAMEEIE